MGSQLLVRRNINNCNYEITILKNSIYYIYERLKQPIITSHYNCVYVCVLYVLYMRSTLVTDE